MRSLTRSVAAVCGALLLAVTVVGCSKEGEEEPGFSTVSPSTTEQAAEEEEQTEEDETSAPPECTDSALRRSPDAPDDYVFFKGCEEEFAFAGRPASAFIDLFQWNPEKRQWDVIKQDGNNDPNGAPEGSCYNKDRIEEMGAPPEILKDVTDCKGDSSTASGDNSEYITSVGLGEAIFPVSYPKCDGRYILILDSIVDDPSLGDTRQRLTEAVAFVGPVGEEGKEFTVPGQCDSLRKQVDGHDIYPVYLDFGKDKSAACSAKSQYGGNVRPLIDGDFASGNNQSVDEARLALDPC